MSSAVPRPPCRFTAPEVFLDSFFLCSRRATPTFHIDRNRKAFARQSERMFEEGPPPQKRKRYATGATGDSALDDMLEEYPPFQRTPTTCYDL